jgi:hypothetical protein
MDGEKDAAAAQRVPLAPGGAAADVFRCIWNDWIENACGPTNGEIAAVVQTCAWY